VDGYDAERKSEEFARELMTAMEWEVVTRSAADGALMEGKGTPARPKWSTLRRRASFTSSSLATSTDGGA
jgi:hypothetical protein